jgi:hypothetical protein
MDYDGTDWAEEQIIFVPLLSIHGVSACFKSRPILNQISHVSFSYCNLRIVILS